MAPFYKSTGSSKLANESRETSDQINLNFNCQTMNNAQCKWIFGKVHAGYYCSNCYVILGWISHCDRIPLNNRQPTYELINHIRPDILGELEE